MEEIKNILGIDWGEKKLGIAISKDNDLPLALTTINQSKTAIVELAKLTEDNQINIIVVGYPFFGVHKNAINKKLDWFIRKIKDDFKNITVDVYDEKMTTQLARRYASKEKEHQEAARIILEDWMNKNKVV